MYAFKNVRSYCWNIWGIILLNILFTYHNIYTGPVVIEKEKLNNHSSYNNMIQDIWLSKRRLNVFVFFACTIFDGKEFHVLTIRWENEFFLISNLQCSLLSFLLWPLVWKLSCRVCLLRSLSFISPLLNILYVNIMSPRRRLYFKVGNFSLSLDSLY